MVGPFIIFDQMGPVEFLLGNGTDVRPRPHIGLSTITDLFTGRSFTGIHWEPCCPSVPAS